MSSLDHGTTTRLSIKSITKRLGVRSKDYSKVEDLYDTRVPLHNEDAFNHGLRFKAKFIGSLEISRPTCKVDIITAMRRIRYEFKVKGVRKIRSNIIVSTQGVKVIKRKRKRSRKHYTEDQLFIMQHPIYRIFYVSHDSQDMKIFSYITRELPDSTFRCNVFKAYKKNMALHIVRSLGQAFDVCHRLNPRPKKTKKEGEEGEGEKNEEEEGKKENDEHSPTEIGSDLSAAMKEVSLGDGEKKPEPTLEDNLIGLDFDPFSFNFETSGGGGAQPNGGPSSGFGATFNGGGGGGGQFPPLMMSNNPSGLPELPTGMQTDIQLQGRPRPRPVTNGANQQNIIQENPFTDTLRTGSASPTLSIGEEIDGHEKMVSNPFLSEEAAARGGGGGGQQWDIYRQQMAGQMSLMKEQLKQETTARIESQARVEHLLEQNKQLLTHVQKLMVELGKLQSLQMAQLLANGTQPPTTSSSSSPPPPPTVDSTTPSATITLPVVTATTSDLDITIASVITTPPTETPPPPPDGGQQETVVVTSTSSSSTTTVTTTDSEQLPPTPFDIPPALPPAQIFPSEQDSAPLIQPNEQGSTPEQSGYEALPGILPLQQHHQQQEEEETEEEEDEMVPLENVVTDLPTNDPFAPQ